MTYEEEVIDMVGRKFSELTVTGVQSVQPNGTIRWTTKCSCGGKKIANGRSLWSGLARHCGCKKKATRIGVKRNG